MKIQVMKVITRVGLLGAVLLAASFASAQGQSLAYRVKANIPFDFTFGEKKLPAGEYSIGRATQNSSDTVLSLTDADGRSRAIRWSMAVEQSNSQSKASLVFHRYGDQYFLVQVWPAGAAVGREFPKSRSERDAGRKLARNSSVATMTEDARVETVTIVGLLQ